MDRIQSIISRFKCRSKTQILRTNSLFLIILILIGFVLFSRKDYILTGLRRNKWMISNYYEDAKDTFRPTLIFTCIGEQAFTKFQPYIWESLRQARLTNPNVSIVVILSKKAFDQSIHHKLSSLRVMSVIHDNLVESNLLLQEFRKIFFVKGSMTPDGNKYFVQFAVERLLSVYAYMNYSGISNVFHIENDNMLYVDLFKLSERMNTCGVKFAIPRAAVNQAVTSFIYVQTSKSMEHFIEWCVNIFRLGPDKAVQYLKTEWINDMTLGAQYLRLYVSSDVVGVYELPTRFYTKSENCCLCYLSKDYSEPIIFDACVLGQYFGGTFGRPNVPHWEENRLVDPRGDILDWQENTENKLKRPYIRGRHIVNIHVHSKQLEKFSSSGVKQMTGKKISTRKP